MIGRSLFVLALLAASGLSQTLAVADPKPGTQKTAQVAPSDALIERTMRAKLAKSKLSADHFTFSVAQGVVTIEGTTNVMQHKGVMTRMAKSSGAKGVRNNIRVSDAARAKATESLARGRGTKTTPASAKSTPTSAKTPIDAPAAPAEIPRATVLPPVKSH